jgi:hypothetical protein
MTSDPCSQVAQCSYFVGPTPGDVLVRMFIEAALGVFLLIWCLRSRRDGLWAAVGSLAAFCWVVVVSSEVAIDLGGSPDLDWWVTVHIGALDWLRLVSLVTVVLAVTVGRTRSRTPSEDRR